MEKIPEGKVYNYPILRIVEEDFIELVKIFSENGLSPRIDIGGYKLDSLPELNGLKDRVITDFEITGYNPLMKLEAHKSCLILFLSDVDSVLQQEIKVKIEKFFREKRRIISHFDAIFSNRIIIIGTCGSIGIIIGKFGIIGVLFVIPICIILGYIIYNSLKKHTILYLTKPNNQLTFWEKNGETIIITAITTIITTIIATIIAGLCLKYI